MRHVLAMVLIAAGLAAPVGAQELSREEIKRSLDAQVKPAPVSRSGGRIGNTRSLKSLGAPVEAVPPSAEPVAPLSFRQIQFAYDSANLTGNSTRTLDTLAAGLSDALADPAYRGVRFPIVGHTDARGTYEYNLVLSQRRAETVVRYLTARGIPSSRLIAIGRGKSELADPDDPTAQANRRVEVRTQL